MSGPLAGLRVIDMTRVLAGPFCTMILADLGADVIKVERPDSGDDSRAFGPFINGQSAYFMSINRGKRSATLNLKDPKAVEILKKLVSNADVLVENFKPGVMKRLGIGYDNLSKLNPRLIYAASSGFGHTGPYSERPAYDLIIQGMGGLMSITGPDADTPTKVGSSVADIFAGIFCAIGILAALISREKSGKGQMVDVAMLDCMVAILENAIARYVATGVDPRPIGNVHPSIAPFMTLRSSDGAFNIACGNDMIWARLCKMLAREDLINDKRFASNPSRVENVEELKKILDQATRSRPTSEWLKKLEEVQVPSGPINSISEILEDAQVKAREMIVEVFHPQFGSLKVPGVPIKFSDTKAVVKQPAPLLGEHNDAIFGSILGLTPKEISDMKSAGII